MKDKPPSSNNPTSSTTQPVIRQRKKPHILPPLEKRRNSVRSFELSLMSGTKSKVVSRNEQTHLTTCLPE
jgi:hypothetical protein